MKRGEILLYNFIIKNIPNKYDCEELIKVFIPADQFKAWTEEEWLELTDEERAEWSGREQIVFNESLHNDKNSVKREIYRFMSQLTGQYPAWGIMTGVRPVKLTGEIFDRVGSEEAVRRELTETYLLSEEKTELLSKLAVINGKLDDAIDELCALACNEEMTNACEELNFIAASLRKSELSDRLFIDLSVLNNTEYYNGIIFQGYVEKAPSAVLSGGRYDKLAGKLRENTQAIGFAVYLDNLNFYYKKIREYDSDILILFDSADKSVSLLSLVESFVEKGFSVRVEHTVPDGYKAKTVYSFENGALREVAVC
jgi:ATP phosphoribosyltransferase regulatory subunit